MAMNARLCEPCQTIFRPDFNHERPTHAWDGRRFFLGEREFPHHRSILDVQACGTSTCRLCEAIWRSIPGKDARERWAAESERAAAEGRLGTEPDLLVTAYPHVLGKEPPDLQSSTWMSFRVESKMCKGIGFWSSLSFKPRELDSIAGLDAVCTQPKGLDSSTWSDKSIQWAKDRIDQCCKDHDECAFSQTTGWIPSRLLYVGKNKVGKACVLQLEQPTSRKSDLGNKVRNWYTKRKSQMVMTEPKISPGKTPGTSKAQDESDGHDNAEKDEDDLIRIVTRSAVPAGSAYLTLSHCWGKSHTLCLTKSFLQQFSQGVPLSALPKTYADAVTVTRSLGFDYIWIDSLCIVQDSKADWHAECGQMANVYTNGVLNIAALHSTDSYGGCIAERDSTFLEPLVIDSPWMGPRPYEFVPSDNEHLYAVLHTRGWVLQERALSPRILQFGENILRWQCRVHAIPESSTIVRDPSLSVFTKSTGPRGEVGGAKSLHELNALWKQLVSEYTNTALTKQQDKLVAFSGVAKVFGSMLQEAIGQECGYLAGLWEPLLKSQLLWFCFSVRGERSRPLEYRAPSWSWTSIDGRISTSGSHVVDWKDELESDLNYFINIKNAVVTPLADDDFYLQLARGYLELNCWLWRVSTYNRSQFRLPEMELEFAWDVEVLEGAGHEVYFIPVVIHHRGPEHMTRVLGLLLVRHQHNRKIKKKTENRFERCGTCVLKTKTSLNVPVIRTEVISCLEEAAKEAWLYDVLATNEFDGEFPDPNQEVLDRKSVTGRTQRGRMRHKLPLEGYIKNFWYRQVITIV